MKEMINKQRALRNRTITLSDADISRLKKRLIKLDKPVSLDEIENKTIHQDIFEALEHLPNNFVDIPQRKPRASARGISQIPPPIAIQWNYAQAHILARWPYVPSAHVPHRVRTQVPAEGTSARARPTTDASFLRMLQSEPMVHPRISHHA